MLLIKNVTVTCNVHVRKAQTCARRCHKTLGCWVGHLLMNPSAPPLALLLARPWPLHLPHLAPLCPVLLRLLPPPLPLALPQVDLLRLWTRRLPA